MYLRSVLGFPARSFYVKCLQEAIQTQTCFNNGRFSDDKLDQRNRRSNGSDQTFTLCPESEPCASVPSRIWKCIPVRESYYYEHISLLKSVLPGEWFSFWRFISRLFRPMGTWIAADWWFLSSVGILALHLHLRSNSKEKKKNLPASSVLFF